MLARILHLIRTLITRPARPVPQALPPGVPNEPASVICDRRVRKAGAGPRERRASGYVPVQQERRAYDWSSLLP